MAVELDHPFSWDKPAADGVATIADLPRVVPCVDGGTVIDDSDPEHVKAEIKVKMGAMSMKFTGTVDVQEKDTDSAVLVVKSREAGGQGHANATVTFDVKDGGGTIHTHAQITGKAASMGEGVMVGVLDALIKDFISKLEQL
jgi:carbon monoxide dehydrogenase subunit G